MFFIINKNIFIGFYGIIRARQEYREIDKRLHMVDLFMKKLLGILVLGLLVSGCGDIYQEMIYQTRYINRALAPFETTHLMGRQCVCYDNVAGTSGIRNNLIEFEDDKLGWIRYYFEFETSQTSNIFALGGYKIYTPTYKGYEYIDFGIWKMNRRGTIIINGDKKNTMRFHLKEEVYKDNKLFVKIKNADYPEGKFFKINLILKDSFHRNMQ